MITLERVDQATAEGWPNAEVVHIARQDVQANAPSLAKALDVAAHARSGQVSGSGEVERTWSYLDSKLGHEHRGTVFIEMEAVFVHVIEAVS